MRTLWLLTDVLTASSQHLFLLKITFFTLVRVFTLRLTTGVLIASGQPFFIEIFKQCTIVFASLKSVVQKAN